MIDFINLLYMESSLYRYIGKCSNIKAKIFEFSIHYKLWLMTKNITFKVLGRADG